MRSNYKKIGEYIELVDERNRDLSITNLLGLSVNKTFIPSVANIIGSDMANYKIIRKGQFACSLMQVRRDGKIPVALLEEFDEAIISQAYPVFEIKNTEELLPQYLMMWMSRSEFDRRACFLAVGGVRGSLEWDDFCDMELPVPSIEKQREIVKEYNVIINRINLNEQLNQKLEETAQAIYKQWFVDFEFPISEEYANSINRPDLIGKPYKSNGGEMVFNDELQQEIPKGWSITTLDQVLTFKNGSSKPEAEGLIPIYGGNGILGYTNKHNNEDIIAIGRVGAYCGSLYRVLGKCWISDNAIYAKSLKNCDMYGLYLLKSLNLNERSEGTGQPLLTQGILNSIDFILPNDNVIRKFEQIAKTIFHCSYLNMQDIELLVNIRDTLLSSMASKQLEAVS